MPEISNETIGKMLLISGAFMLGVNAYELLPHTGGVNASLGKVIFCAAIIFLGWLWSKRD